MSFGRDDWGLRFPFNLRSGRVQTFAGILTCYEGNSHFGWHSSQQSTQTNRKNKGWNLIMENDEKYFHIWRIYQDDETLNGSKISWFIWQLIGKVFIWRKKKFCHSNKWTVNFTDQVSSFSLMSKLLDQNTKAGIKMSSKATVTFYRQKCQNFSPPTTSQPDLNE